MRLRQAAQQVLHVWKFTYAGAAASLSQLCHFCCLNLPSMSFPMSDCFRIEGAGKKATGRRQKPASTATPRTVEAGVTEDGCSPEPTRRFVPPSCPEVLDGRRERLIGASPDGDPRRLMGGSHSYHRPSAKLRRRGAAGTEDAVLPGRQPRGGPVELMGTGPRPRRPRAQQRLT
jgi:hypothetical protein